MARPLPINRSLLSCAHYPLRPAQLELAEYIGRKLVWATGDKRATAERIYNGMSPEMKARADFAGSRCVLEGGAQ